MPNLDGRRVLLVVSGGIAAYKSATLVRRLRQSGATVDVVMTGAAEKMVGGSTFEALSGRRVHTDLWTEPLTHVELGREADLAIVAPATAHIMARLAHGLADDMATTTLLATACPVLLCPAMNVRMWESEATRDNVDLLSRRGMHLLGPEHGELAEGEVGTGRMAEPDHILQMATRILQPESALAGRGVVVTAGPTRAAVDPVRYLGNRSSGRMGFALAAAAWRRGADVVLIAGPTSVDPPFGPRLTRVETSDEMGAALRHELEDAAVLIMAAAVADFVVREPAAHKIKRDGSGPVDLRLEIGADLLEETRELRATRHVLTLGFALETEDFVPNARRKMAAKGMDLVALNEAGRPDTGFDAETNQVTLLDSSGIVEELPLLPKDEVAERLLDRLEERLA